MSRNPVRKLFKDYLNRIAKTTNQGDAREESYYPALEALLEVFAREVMGRQAIEVTVLPKKTEAGNPDFRVWDGQQRIVGYIEAKKPDADLERIEDSEQLKRYRETFPNLILTDFYEFRLYRDGELVDRVQLARPFIAREIKQTPPLEKVKELNQLLQQFMGFSLPRSLNAEKLAVELAKRTRFLRDQVIAEELREKKDGRGDIHGFYEAFQKYLIKGLTEKQFADLYAQTIAYGLFAARTRAGDDFSRELAFKYIPHTIGILRDVFHFISLGDPPKAMQVMVDDIADVLRAADVRGILHQFFQEGKGEDPILHFYETFLAQYDPATRERRGVYYTPEPVVRYIVRSLHSLLQSRFDMPDGLAAREVTLLDPAAGTLTFPAQAIQLAVSTYEKKYGSGGVKKLIHRQILRNYYAFEIMMAPYAIGHMKIGFLLEELGYKMGEDERFQLYLTNTLEMEEIEQIAIPGLSSLSEESRLAGRVKKDEPILVILGNPPYSGISANINEWTEKLLRTNIDGAQSYYEVDGHPLGERKVWLQDDYVKFLRFAQWKIQRAGRGVVGMITNHGYLDNPTFRGMRQSLMGTFDEIYILNLHGNSLRRETAPDGSPDENVFDIRQGVAIALFIKLPNKKEKEKSLQKGVFYVDLWGKRKPKYRWLNEHYFSTTSFEKIYPKSPFYFFQRRPTETIRHYLKWPKVDLIFDKKVTGVQTSRDKLVVSYSFIELKNRLIQLTNPSVPDAIITLTYGVKDTYFWNLANARAKLRADSSRDANIIEYLYRPLDKRYVIYSLNLIHRPRLEVMQHMLAGKNLGLVVGRQGQAVGKQFLWNLAFISDTIIDLNLYYRGGAMLFPLYLYPSDTPGLKQGDLFSEPITEKTPNIPNALFQALAQAYGFTPTPEDILAYIYAVFYSNLYRTTYDPFLRVDFPRVPFTARAAVFRQLAGLGQRLIALHLLKSDELHPPVVRYQGEDDDKIERIRYDEEKQRVYINKRKYFEGVAPAVWNYQIGGYQVLHKYLKDRKGRAMDHPRRYIHIATAIARTIALQEEIDAIYPQVEEEVLAISL